MINVTVHDISKDNNRNKLLLINSEQYKKEKFNATRKKRIQDVRQKSKEFAHKLRENVRKETENQMKRIERTKADELRNWKQQKLREAQIRQCTMLWDVGDAHKAAEAENLEQMEWEMQKQIAATRHGFRNKPKLKITRPNTPKKLVRTSAYNQPNVEKKNTFGPNVNNKENLEVNFTDSKSHIYPNVRIEDKGDISDNSDDLRKQCLNENRSVKNAINEQQNVSESLQFSKICDVEKHNFIPASYADFKELQKKGLLNPKIKKTNPIVMDIGHSDTSASSVNIEDNHMKDNKLFCRMYSKNSPKKSHYNPKEFQQPAFENPSPVPVSTRTRFNQISKLIKHTNEENHPEIDKNVKKITDINNKLQKIISSPKKSYNNSKKILDTTELYVNQNYVLSPKTDNALTKDQCSSSLQKTQLTKLSISPQKINIKKPTTNIQSQPTNKKKNDILADQKQADKCKPQKLPNFCLVAKKPVSQKTATIISKSPAQKKPLVNETKSGPENKTNMSRKPTERAMKPLSTNIKSCTSRSVGPSAKSIDCQTSRVKFYDYNNKFSKEYDPELRARVTSEENTLDNLNAMQNADIERQLEIEKEKEIELLRQKSNERCQKALEREKVRRDYESLQAKLDSLTVFAQPNQNINDEYLFSEARLKRQAEGREIKINSAVEDILQRPVIITCPDIDHRSEYREPEMKQFAETKKIQPNGVNVADNMYDDGLNNSDSCCSILLNYVDNQSKQIKADIDKCGNNYEKEKKLKSLLSRINILRSTLLDELKKISESQKIDSINEMIDSLSHLRKERENIMVISSEKKDLEKREKQLQKKEQILEKKIRQFYELKKSDKTSKHMRPQSLSSNDENSNDDDSNERDFTAENVIIQKKTNKTNPIEILITVKNPKAQEKCTQTKTKLDSEKPVQKIKNHLKNPIQREEKEEDLHDQKSEGSTQYQDYPNKMCNTLDDLVMDKCPNQLSKQQSETISKKIEKNATTIQKRNLSTSKDNTKSFLLTEQPKNATDAQLSTYIQRLLGMSRQSIHMLGASTSSVETPSLSVINSPTNIADLNEHDKERLERLQSFIDENYSFLSELEESLKTDRGQTSSNNGVRSEIWKKTLKKSFNNNEKKTLVLKPILKKPSPPKKSRKTNLSTIMSKNERDLPHQSKSNQIKKSVNTNITTNTKTPMEQEKHEPFLDNCIDPTDDQIQRLNELNDMIKLVRNEKQKLLENTRSPIGLNELGICSDPTTDYLDLPQKNIGGSSSDSTKISNSHLDEDGQTVAGDKQYKSEDNIREIIDEEQVNLEKNKLTGMSRDSGISLSRPVTALDNCDSPIADTRREKSVEAFEPFLKNIPKPGKVVHEDISTSSINPKGETDNKIVLTSRRQKPPTTITRYSPAEIAHELSTILEIDTPATLQINTSEQFEEPKINKLGTMETILEIEKPVIDTDRLNFDKFATFAEYSREDIIDQLDRVHNTDLTVYHHDSFRRCTQPVKTPLNTSQRSFQSDGDHLSKSSSIDLANSIARIELTSKKFSTPKEYFEKQAHEDNIIDMAERILASSSSSSAESLLDINTELKRRNMQPLPMNIESVEDKSKKSNRNQQDIQDLSGIGILHSTKSKSSELEKDLDNMGMSWASRMLKKTKQTQALSSSSISTISENYGKPKTRRKYCGKELSQNSDDSDELSNTSSCDKISKSIDRKFFLAEELKKHSLSSNSFSENSLVSFLIKSLMLSPKQQRSPVSSGQINKEKQHKTSTPKTSDTSIFSSTAKRSSLDTNSIKLFSGESRLSSVRLSDSSSDFIKRN